MGRLVGMDEAGYGPNLGPLVITATVWPIEGDPRDFEPWSAFSEVVSDTGRTAGRLFVADSKRVTASANGFRRLETAVLALLGLAGFRPSRLSELWRAITGEDELQDSAAPWLDENEVVLPCAADVEEIDEAVDRWEAVCRRAGVGPVQVHSDVVTAARFNGLLEQCDNKALVLSQVSLALLASLCDPDGDEPTLVIADKHGGRNRYDELLGEALGDRLVFRLAEGAEQSRYRVGRLEVRFQPRAEKELPVALASMVSKYVRELVMIVFNRYWSEQVPGLRPTKGYPVDARRFREDVGEALSALGIDEGVFWRSR